MKKLLEKIRRILRNRRTRQLLTRAVSITAAVVVFITTYALVLPAITMETTALCGIEEHEHTDDCYTEELICGLDESPGHRHDESCYTVSRVQICEEEEHQHTGACYDQEGKLVCEKKEHQHTDKCFKEEKELTCEIPESEGHTHTEECYRKTLTCGKEVHIHSAACYEDPEADDDGDVFNTSESFEDFSEDGAGSLEDDGEKAAAFDTEGYDSDSESDWDDSGDFQADDDTDQDMEITEDDVSDPDNEEFGDDAKLMTEEVDEGDSDFSDSDEENTYAETGEEAGDELAEDSGEEAGEEIEEETDEGTGEEFGEEADEGTGEEFIEEAGEEIGEEADEEAGDEFVEEAGEEIAEEAGEGTGEEVGEETGEETVEEAGEETGDAIGEEAGEEINEGFAEETGAENIDDESLEEAEGTKEETEPAEGQAQTAEEEADSASTDAEASAADEKSYVPELEQVKFDTVLNKETGIYYYHVSDEENIEDSSTVTGWSKVEEDTELGRRDLLRVYLAYTIPAGSLNETNPTARYRLPDNIRLSQEQIEAINKSENGITAAYDNSEEDHGKYLGAEAVEGSRKPDEQLLDDGQEFISATVKAENIYDEEGNDGEERAYLGQDLIFTFVPYTIEKNRNIYDAEQNIVSAGEELTGWFVCDLNTDQVEWGEETVISETEPDQEPAEDKQEVQETLQDNSEGNQQEQQAQEGLQEDGEAIQDNSEGDQQVQEALQDNSEDSREDGEAIQDNSEGDQQVQEALQDNSEGNQQEQQDQQAQEGLQEDGEALRDNSEDNQEIRQDILDKTGDDTGNDPDRSRTRSVTLERTAEIIFVTENTEEGIEEISSRLRLVEHTETEETIEEDTDPDEEKEAEEDSSSAGTEEEIMEDTAGAEKDAEKDADKEAEKDADEDTAGREDKIEDDTEDTADAEKDAAEDDAAGKEKDAAEPAAEKADTAAETSKETGDQTEKEPQEFKSGTLTADGDGYRITLDYTAEAQIPDDAELSVREITAKTDKAAYELCLARAKTHVGNRGQDKTDVDASMSRFFDIEILARDSGREEDRDTADHTKTAPGENAAGTGATMRKIEPAAPVKVSIEILDVPETASGQKQQSEPTVLHFDEEGVVQIDASATTEEATAETDSGEDDSAGSAAEAGKKAGKKLRKQAAGAFGVSGGDTKSSSGSDAAAKGKKAGKTLEIQFEAESFSIYGIVYTVDFRWEVNGKEYAFSIPGGGFVSLQHLVEVLGIADNDRSSENASDDAGDGGDFSREKEIEGSAGAGGEQGADNSGTQSEAGSNHYEEAINLNNAVVSEKTREFVADVSNVEFSNPDLVWAGKVDQESTVGGLKQANGLECEYSADLTGDQIDEINSSTVEGGDWALISMLPFLSEETLTVTMKNGDQFAIRVTDGQIKKTVIDARGDTWEITVTYGEDALIPDGSVLEAHLLSEDEEEYLRAKESVQKVNDISVSAPEKESVDPDRAEAEAGEDAESSLSGSSPSMMAFDISIVDPEGNIIEPKSEVSVSIALKSLPDGSDLAYVGQTLEVYHIVKTEDKERAVLVADAGNGSEGTVTIAEERTVAEFVTESFSVYTVKWGNNQQVRLHFVDEAGNELTGVKLNGTTIDGSSVTINSSNPSSTLPFDNQNILDLTTAFTVDGKTLSSTHRGTPNDILPGVSKPTTSPYTNAQQPHSIIGNELKWSGSSIQYHYYYTNSDKAGSVWMNSGYRPKQSDIDDASSLRPDSTPVYDGSESYDGYTTYDYFLVYSPDYDASTSGAGQHDETPELDDVGKSKLLTDNRDGTYTLDLSVTTDAKKDEKFNDINIILVLDTSSSMRRDSQDRRPTDTGYDGTTRRMILTADAIEKFINNLKQNNTTANPDAVEMELITFNAYASVKEPFTTDLDSIITTVWNLNGGRTHTGTSDQLSQGTNWADGLRLAKETTVDDDDPTFVLFLTDGAPSEYWPQTSAPGGSLLFVDGGGSYLGAREEGRAMASTGRELYGVFSFGTTTDQENDYLGELLDYSYSDNVRQERGFYARDGDELLAYLNKILEVIYEAIGHTGLNYHDGIALDTASTALKTGGVNGTIGGITYSKTGGTSPSYTVVADTDGSIKSFKVNGTEYKNSSTINDSYTYNKISGGQDGVPITVTEETATVYQCTVGSGDNAVTYTMPIASLDINNTTKIGDLNWDLSPLGMLEDGATYKISFVIWPDQEAYNYVAELNNADLREEDKRLIWNTTTKEPVYAPDGTTVLYYRNGVPQYPNIVYYPDEDYFAALTNTSQDVTYYVEDQISNEDTTYTGPETIYPETPNPMPLTSTESKIEKAWSVERSPWTMAQLLYDENGDPTEFAIKYGLFFDDDPEAEDAEPYVEMTLGWDGTKYDWEPSSIRYVTYNGHRVPVGMRWTKSFAIATGLMLSEARMDELGLDKTDTRYKEYIYNSTKYYILEPGHDYKIEEIIPEDEESWVTYEFDFISPDYHPMLVDGKLKNVIFTKDEDHQIISIKEISKDDWLASLKIENTLRGYICLDKVVVDKDGETPLPTDETKFEYRIELHNSTDPGPFTEEGSNVPWFGINNLYYHDEDWNYYQAEVYDAPDPRYPNKSHYLTIRTESGEEFDARCTNSDGSGWDDTDLIFDEDITGPTWITYYDEENDRYVTFQVFGNQMNHQSDNYVWAVLKIDQSKYLTISNVPTGTTYIVRETDDPRYDFVGAAMPSGATLSGTTVSGRIIPDSDNHITYTNKIHSAAVVVKKVDEKGKALPGAKFTLKRTSGPDYGQSEYDNDGVTKPDSEEDDTDTGTYRFEDLPDGQYSLVETSPPDGFTGLTESITFTVSGGRIQENSVRKPAGVDWNSGKFTFTVPNTPIVSGITVRKQWLDYFGNAEDYDGTLDLKLIQWVHGDLPEHTVSVYLRCRGDGNGGGIPGQITAIADRSWTGKGDAVIFSWDWNRTTALKEDGGDASFIVDVPEGVSYETSATAEGRNYRVQNGRPYGKRQYVRFSGITENTIIYITIDNGRYTGISNANNYNTDVHSIRPVDPDPIGPLEPTGGTKTVTLGNGGVWMQSFEVSGDGLLLDSSTTLPATYTVNGVTKPCYYSISEEDIPPGYTLEQISEDQTQSGVLTAYNRNNTELGSLHITKTVHKNGLMDTSAQGTFYYAVYDELYDSGADPPQTPVRTGSIEVTAFGSATVTEDNLKAGKYYVYELTGLGGTPVESEEGGIFNNGKYYDVTTTGSQAVVNENDPPTVHIINNYETTSVTATKTWEDLSTNESDHPTIFFKLYYSTETGDIAVNGADLKPLPHGTTEVSWTDVPLYDENRTPYVYLVKEFIQKDDGEYEENGVHYTEAAPNGYVSEEEGLSITNTQSSEYEPKTSYPGKKIWVDSANGHATRPNLTVTLMIDKTGNGPSDDDEVVMDGDNPMVPSWTKNGDIWTYSFGNGNLPVFDDDDHIIHYYAVEEPVTGYESASPGYPVDPDDPESLGITPTSYTYLNQGTMQHVPNDADINIPSDVDNLPFVGVVINAYGYNYHLWTVREVSDQEKTELLRYFNDDLQAHNLGRPATMNNTRFVNGLPVSKEADGNVEFVYGRGYKVRINKGDGDTLKVGIDGSRYFTSITVGSLKYHYDSGQTVFKNSLLTEDLDVLKTWGEGVSAPDGAEVVITLKGTIQTEVSGGDPEDPPQGEETVQETEINYISVGVIKTTAVLNGGLAGGDDTEEPWVYSWKGLPQYDASGNRITWTASETSYTINGITVPDTFAPLTGSDTTYELIVTNQIPKYSFEILKEDEVTKAPLPGAQFTIRAVQPASNTSSVTMVEGSEASDPETTDDDGMADFENVELGYYEAKEEKTPGGYILTGDKTFYIKVDVQGVKLLEKVIIDGKLSFREARPDDNGIIKVGNVTYSISGTTVTFTVDNTPGAALPHTGGPGTDIFTILGSMLILGAAFLLWWRRGTI
ncbi:MAG: Cna B-type domain-containing protein [Lachnospiraceae bacterium]|nr:Cna B-type domain-containing protein [Lachnospiraceae bacterium]